MKKAKYRGIPVYYNPETAELVGRNWFYDLLVGVNVWIDANLGIDFLIEIEED